MNFIVIRSMNSIIIIYYCKCLCRWASDDSDTMIFGKNEAENANTHTHPETLINLIVNLHKSCITLYEQNVKLLPALNKCTKSFRDDTIAVLSIRGPVHCTFISHYALNIIQNEGETQN